MLESAGKIWRAPLNQKWMVLEAIWELAIARGLVRFSKFRRWKDRMGVVTALPADGAGAQGELDPQLERQADDLGRVVRAVARRMPFKANCLPQASAAQVMLKRRGIKAGKLFLGGRIADLDKPMLLHAWLYVGQVCVTGDDGPGDLKKFKPLMMFSLDSGTV